MIHLGQKVVGSNLGIICFTTANLVNGLHRDASRMKELSTGGMGCGYIWGKSMSFIQPVSLSELCHYQAFFLGSTKEEVTAIPYTGFKFVSCFPINLDQFV